MINIIARPRFPALITLFFSLLLNIAPLSAQTTTEDPSESLLSLPYLGYVTKEKAPNKTGTTIYKKDKVWPGYNIYASQNKKDNFIELFDMDGNIIHKWTQTDSDSDFQWHEITPFSNGSIFITGNLTSISWELIDANSHVLRQYALPDQKSHHAVYYIGKEGFLGIVAKVVLRHFKDLQITLRVDSIVQVSPQGEVIKEVRLDELLHDDPVYQKKLQAAYKKSKKYLSNQETKQPILEPFHTNNVARLEWDIPGIAKKGAWLVTIPRFDRIILIDPEQKRVIWQWGDSIISFPHHATFIKKDKILLFDNGNRKKASRVIILDIRSKKIIWQYGQKPGQEFFTSLRGSAQLLPNGNILIVESNQGRAFEVTNSGEIVWEWYADFYTNGPHKGKRKAMYRMERLPYNFFENEKLKHARLQP